MPSRWERARVFLPLRSWKLQVVGAAVGLVVAIVSAQSLASAREGATTYLVQPGDTLSAIATATGIPVDKLVSLNSIQDPNLIVAGQTLSVAPGAAPAPPSAASSGASVNPASAQYMVKSGDTLWDIAQANGVSVDDLVQANTLGNADQLTVGQVLRLPGAAAGVQHSATIAAAKPKPGSAAAASSAAKPGSQSGALLQKVIAQAQKVGGPNVHVGVAATNLTTGEKLSWHADDEFPSASVMKLPILVELERQIAAGQLSWTESLRAEVSAMIGVSDNTAANEIADAIHPPSVNDSMAKLGLSGTRFLNLFNDARSSQNPGENQTTPANMARLLELIANNQVVSAQVSGDIRSLLARNTDRSKLVRLLPADAQVAHKSGWYDGVANDVGIVTVNRGPTRWVIAVFSENLPDAETGNQLIATISKVVYDTWAQ
ncbi:MAG: serine hydrolase [Chloroflexi bacterium]|nr:serine hydrolase [Chloroflexota bacterium]MBV9602323.1 serine hydrolase [Chloroflexota bacterium]